MLLNLLKIFLPATVALLVGLAFTPFATGFFYRHRMWKKHSRGNGTDVEFKKIHNETEELRTPRVGGIIIWVSVLLTTIIFFVVPMWLPSPLTEKMNFLSRGQTLIPLLALLAGAMLGLLDDLLQIYPSWGKFFGLRKVMEDDKSWRFQKAGLIVFVSLLLGGWFYFKLGMESVHIPFDGELFLGILIIPLFVLVALGTFSGGVIDGLDGLSGGVLASIFAAYSMIAFAGNHMDLSAFSAVITGAILAFLWFNIPPARFYMGETGMIGLSVTLATLAFLSDTVLVLPVIAMPLVISSLSVMLQLLSKKFRGGKKLFRVAPLHHHFEAVGWPATKVVMRFWIFSVAFSIIGIILAIVSR